MPQVLISDKMSPLAADVLRERGLDVVVDTDNAPDELAAKMNGFDGLIVRSATKVRGPVLDHAEHLRVIGRAGIGVDNIDIPAATQKGVVVMNAPFGNAITTAEHAVALMFALARQIPQANLSTHAGKWEKSKFMGVELFGKTLGLIGCGNIGSIVSDRAQGVHMRVIAYDPFLPADRAMELGVEKVDLEDLLARADFISLHTPMTDATRGIIDAAALAKTKKGVYVVNCARGGLVVEQDLKAAIESGHVAGAAIDVFTEEPAHENPLFGMDGVICTPHLGASTAEAQEKVAVQIAEQVADFLLTGAVQNAINMPSVTAEEAPRLRPYMKLAEELGSFAGQLTRTGLKGVTIEYDGAVTALNRAPIKAALLKGLLEPLLDSVNMVNAPQLAHDRNIEISETVHDRACDYPTLITLTVTTERRSRSVSGTLFGGDRPRVVNIKGVEIEAEVAPNMLYITNQDVPGFIGALGTTLGDAGVNIATFHLGRAERGGDAVSLVSVDEPVSKTVLAKIKSLPHVVQVVPLKF